MADTEHDLVTDAVEQLLGQASTPRRVREVEDGASHAALWRAIQESGFADALVPEEEGGAGLGLSGAFPIVLACGRHAVPVPFAQTMVVRAVLAGAGKEWPEGPATFARAAEADGAAVTCLRVPYGCAAEWVLVGRSGSSVLLPVAAAQVTPTRVRGSLEADLRWASLPQDAMTLAGEPPWQTIGAALYAAQLAGAMDRVLELTVAHANDRTQFGRSIGKFQAIQQQLAVMAEQVFASRMAARIGCRGASYLPGELQAAVAKARTSEAAAVVAAIAHSVQGAMGITEEGDLQLYTRRLHEWRLGYGAERHWNERIGEAVLAERRGRFAAIVRERLSPSDG
jgi:alkylation response protein AidB-like acyl-CoA dehydrogenase